MTRTSSQGAVRRTGRYAFDVQLCDRDDLPAALTARVVLTVTEA